MGILSDPFVLARTPLYDTDGNINPVWMMFFRELWIRVGKFNSPSVTDIETDEIFNQPSTTIEDGFDYEQIQSIADDGYDYEQSPAAVDVGYDYESGPDLSRYQELSYIAITGARTLEWSDELVNCTSGTFAVTLPTAVGFTKQYIVKNSGTGIITINTTSAQTVDGSASGVITLNQYDSMTFRSDGTNWIIV